MTALLNLICLKRARAIAMRSYETIQRGVNPLDKTTYP